MAHNLRVRAAGGLLTVIGVVGLVGIVTAGQAAQAAPASARAVSTTSSSDPLARLEIGLLGTAVVLGLAGGTGLWLTRRSKGR